MRCVNEPTELSATCSNAHGGLLTPTDFNQNRHWAGAVLCFQARSPSCELLPPCRCSLLCILWQAVLVLNNAFLLQKRPGATAQQMI